MKTYFLVTEDGNIYQDYGINLYGKKALEELYQIQTVTNYYEMELGENKYRTDLGIQGLVREQVNFSLSEEAYQNVKEFCTTLSYDYDNITPPTEFIEGLLRTRPNDFMKFKSLMEYKTIDTEYVKDIYHRAIEEFNNPSNPEYINNGIVHMYNTYYMDKLPHGIIAETLDKFMDFIVAYHETNVKYNGKYFFEVYSAVSDILQYGNVTEKDIESVYTKNRGHHGDTVIRAICKCSKTPTFILEKILMMVKGIDDMEEELESIIANPNTPSYLKEEAKIELATYSVCPCRR